MIPSILRYVTETLFDLFYDVRSTMNVLQHSLFFLSYFHRSFFYDNYYFYSIFLSVDFRGLLYDMRI